MLIDEIKSKLKTVDKAIVAKKLKYGSLQRFEATLDKFLKCNSIAKWLKGGHYDMLHDEFYFLLLLSQNLGIDMKMFGQEINQAIKTKIELEKLQGTYIFVETNFKRKNEPIHVLGTLENIRMIKYTNDERLVFKTIDEICQILSEDIQQHYIQNDGKLAIWGNIDKYILYLLDKVFIFDTQGNLILCAYDYFHDYACISIKKGQ